MYQRKSLTFCQHCHMKCRLYVTVEEGQILSIENRMGIDGAKAVRADELIYHPDRLIHPLKRQGPKGAGSWERISWNEALDMMAHKFSQIKRTHGAEANATIIGCGHKEMAYYATFLFSHIVGTPNVLDINRQCNIPTLIGGMLTFGEGILTELSPDFLRSRCILLWGANPRHTYPPLDNYVCAAQNKGAKVITVDPRPPERLRPNVRPSDLWLRIKPGTDAFLALSMIKVLIDEKLYDEEFVVKWCVGFDRLKDHVKEYTLEKAEEVTEIPKKQIVDAVTMFCTIKPSCLYTRLGATAQHVNATQTARAIAILTALGGSIDIPGGNLFSDEMKGYRHQRSISQFPSFPSHVEGLRYGAKEYPFICAPKGTLEFFPSMRRSHSPDCIEAMLSGKIRGFYVPGSNIVVAEANSRKICEALHRLEFLVVAELFMTPTAELADLVLPVAHFLETEVPMRAYQRMGPNLNNYILASRKVVEPQGECWDDRKIMLELAKRMGVELPWNTVEEFNDWTLEGVGIRFKELQNMTGQQFGFPVEYEKYKKLGFRTPSGKIELFSKTLEDLNHDSLPVYKDCFAWQAKEVSTKEYPLILISHRDVNYMHSEFRQVSSLRNSYPEPLVEINPETAAAFDIQNGDWIVIKTAGFKDGIRGKARYVRDIHPKVISCLSHWWFPEKDGPEHGCFESNVNAILSYGPPFDPITGAHQGRSIMCNVTKNA